MPFLQSFIRLNCQTKTKKKIKIILALLLVVIISASSIFIDSSRAKQIPSFQKLSAKVLVAARKSALADFKSSYGQDIIVKWNDLLNIPSLIYTSPISPQRINPGVSVITTSNIDKLAKKFLEDNYSLFKIDTEDLVTLKIEEDQPLWPEHKQGMITIIYEQIYQGVKVHKSRVSLTAVNNQFVKVSIGYYPDIKITMDYELSEEQVFEIIQNDLEESDFAPLDYNLNIYPEEKEQALNYYLAWKVDLPPLATIDPSPPESFQEIVPLEPLQPKKKLTEWTYFIDAQDGRIIEKINKVSEATLSGRVTGQIYPENPLEGDSQEPFASENIYIGSTKKDTTDNDGYYQISNLSGTVNLKSYFRGPHTEVYNEAGAEAYFSQNITVPATLNWNWRDYDHSYKQEESNVFYHTNIAYDYFNQGSPFNITPGPHPMKAYVQVTVGASDESKCNAYAVYQKGIYFLPVSEVCEATSLGADIIYHEYSHHIVNFTLYDVYTIPDILGEPLADYFAATITSDPLIAENILPSYYIRNLDNSLRYPQDIAGDDHNDGQIFAGALWDIREALGQNLTDELVMRTVKLNGASNDYSWRGFLDDLLIIDDNDGRLSNGTPHIEYICQAFSDNHGIFSPNCLGYIEYPLAEITAPKEEELFFTREGAEIIYLEGKVYAPTPGGLVNYSLKWQKSGTTYWSNQGFSLANEGVSQGLFEGVLGTWDLGQISGEGIYILRIEATSEEGKTVTDEIEVKLWNSDGQLQGWPKQVENNVYGISTPALGDLDGDGDLEIVATASILDNSKVYAWHNDGRVLEGWPRSLGSIDYIISSPAIGDLEGDGDLEIVVSTQGGEIYVWQHDQAVADAVAREMAPIESSPALGDLDGDGDLEIVVGSNDGYVYAWHKDGTSLSGWPKKTRDTVKSSPALGDLDGDGDLEVVVGSYDGYVYAWDKNGTSLSGWPQETGDSVKSSPALGDLDGDGELEIIVGSNDSYVYAWHRNGAIMSGWPKKTDDEVNSSPALGDLAGDGDLEIVVGSNSDRYALYGWRSDGSKIDSNWPLELRDCVMTGSPALVDLDQDADLEILAACHLTQADGLGAFYAWHHNAELAAGWPKRIVSGAMNASPTINDLDRDGDIEVILRDYAGYLYVWNLAEEYSQDMTWKTFRHNFQRTGLYEVPYLDLLTRLNVETVSPYYLSLEAVSIGQKEIKDNLSIEIKDYYQALGSEDWQLKEIFASEVYVELSYNESKKFQNISWPVLPGRHLFLGSAFLEGSSEPNLSNNSMTIGVDVDESGLPQSFFCVVPEESIGQMAGPGSWSVEMTPLEDC